MEGGELDEGEWKQLPQEESFDFVQINDDLADK